MKRLFLLVRYTAIVLIIFGTNRILSAQDKKPYILKPVANDAYNAILQFYQYDKDIPFELNIIESVENKSYKREKIVFTGINNSRVTGFLAIPKTGEPPYPCVLQMHGLNVSKNDFWEEEYHHGRLITQGLLSSGYAVLALDMPYHGERLYENDFESALITLFKKGWGYRIRDMVVQSTIEYRRAIDYLGTRTDIDMNRIGALGYSLGSVITLILTGVDDRVKTSVACATAIIKPRTFFPPEEYLSGFAPQTFVKYYKNKHILIVAARNDEFNCTIAEAEQLFSLIEGSNKELIFYDSGHKLPPEHSDKVVEWILKNLK